jgi:hypothetical protein
MVLLGLGLLGIVAHNLIEMNKLNKLKGNDFSFMSYIKKEYLSMLVSVVVVVIALLIKNEIKQLDKVSDWLGLSFVTIGYMGQSILIFFMGKAQKEIKEKIEETEK